MSYLIWDTLRGAFLLDDCTCGECFVIYATSEQAQAACKSSQYPVLRNDDAWAVRERLRAIDGTYEKVVWHDESWYQERYYILDNYAHVKSSTSDLLFFTPSPIKGRKDIQEGIAPGRYLQKFFGDILDQEEIKTLVDRHREAYRNDMNVQFASTPEQIAAVYSMPAGFVSCMQVPASTFNMEVHPTSIYGAGDLEVAYLCNKEKLIARAVIWRAKNKVGRVYGDAALLRAGLKKHGIKTTSNNENFDSFVGARLLYVPLPSKGHRSEDDDDIPATCDLNSTVFPDIVIPYIDYSEEGMISLKVDGDYLITAPNDTSTPYIMDSAMGYCVPRLKCPCCGKFIIEGISIVTAVDYALGYNDEKRYIRQMYCGDCGTDDLLFRCNLTNHTYLKSTFNQLLLNYYKMVVCLEAVEDRVFKSSFSREWFLSSDKVVIGNKELALPELPQALLRRRNWSDAVVVH